MMRMVDEPTLLQIWRRPEGGLCLWVDYTESDAEPREPVAVDLPNCGSMAGMLRWIVALASLTPDYVDEVNAIVRADD